MDLIATILGAIGYSLAFWGYFSKNDLTTKWTIVVGSITNAAMYGVLGMYISLGVVVLTGIRTFSSIYWCNTRVGLVFLALNASLPLWIPNQGWMTALPGITGVIAMYWMKGISMKVMLVLTSLIWIVINLEVQNWIAVIGQGLMMVFGIAGIVRLHRLNTAVAN